MDTNVFISFWDNEYGRNITDFLEYYSKNALDRVLSCKFHLIISDLTIKELSEAIRPKKSREEILTYFEPYEKLDKIRILVPDTTDWEEARRLRNTTGLHLKDALHTVLAKKTKSTLVTWNLKDFQKAGKEVEVRSPKNL